MTYRIIEPSISTFFLSQTPVARGLSHDALEWKVMKVRACAHGQVIESGKHAGKALTKTWRVVSTIPDIAQYLDLPCPKTHEHVATAGQYTLSSGKYPPGLATQFHRCLKAAEQVADPGYRTLDLHGILGL